MFRVDWIPKGTCRPQTTWHATERAADLAAWRLKFGGIANVLVWFDAAIYEGAV